MQGLHIPVLQCLGRKILQIEGHDHPTSGADRCRQHMAVLRVVFQARLDRLVAFNTSIRKMGCELLASVGHQRFGPLQNVQQRAVRLGRNFRTPFWNVEPGCLRQSEQQVGHSLIREHTGIQDDREVRIHDLPTRSVQPGLLCEACQFIEGLTA